MYPWLRFFRIHFFARLHGKIEPLGESALRFRSGLSDLDYNLHVNNGRYLTIMDLGRYDLMVRLGLLRLLRQRRWMPVVAAATVRFARPVGLWKRFELHTRVVGWDDRWIFLEQRWTRAGTTVCLAWLKTAFRGTDGVVPPRDVMAAAGWRVESPALPVGVAAWGAAEASGPIRV